ncbi:MAG: YggS family pyridoxal phosphate-dependent enzyme [Eubacteriales bacterium]|nr:YggS family pyridoxal phosphate-dependent enzyme [Eubacteriales bacterium]
MIEEQIEVVKKNIAAACERSGRNFKDVSLIAVSKTKPNEILMEAYNSGIRLFGENYVQELMDKMETLPSDIEWHMIGHLQRNKVKYIVGRVSMIHSVDSVRLAEEISKESIKKNVITDILLEINVALEANKFGFTVEETYGAVLKISKMKGIRVRGLMTSAPNVEKAEENRDYFRKLKQLCVDINEKNIDNISMDTLSMGMTNDYSVAIEEGATFVRVGTAIFGARNYMNNRR